MRNEFGSFIADLAKRDKSVVLISLDAGSEAFARIQRENPSQYLNLGVTEQAAIGVASGMALEGLRPYVFTIAPFLLERPFEQVKLDIVQQRANVKLVGYWNYPTAGPTHTIRDVKGLCKILEIPLIEPKNSQETRRELERTYSISKPFVFYLTKDPEDDK